MIVAGQKQTIPHHASFSSPSPARQLPLIGSLPARQNLRPYQSTAVAKAKAEIARGNTRIVLTIPTGGGKTTVAAHMIEEAVHSEEPVMFLAHRRELIDQCSERLDQHDIPHGVIMAGTDRRDHRQLVQVASIQTLRNRALPPAKWIFVDECHLSVAPTFQELLNQYPEANIVGLTATPYRLDGKGLGRIYHALVEVTTAADLMAEGHLIKPVVLSTPRPDLSGVKSRNGDYDAVGLAAAMDKADLVGDVVDHWQRYAPCRRTVVFASSVEHSIHLVERFKQAGIAAEHIDANTPNDQRKATLARLKSGETLVVSNVEILTAGWDMPSLEVCVLARPTQSLSLCLQMVGRILRPYPGKLGALILDHAGCMHDHGLPDEDRCWSLDGPRDRAQPLPPSVMNCPQCYAIVPSRTATCPHCLYAIAKAAAAQLRMADLPEEAAGELVEFTEAQRTAIKRARFFELIDEADRLGYSQGWASHRYHEEFGVWPGSMWKAELRRRA